MSSTCPDCKKTFQVLCECTRLTCKWTVPKAADPLFDYDALDNDNCIVNTRSYCDDPNPDFNLFGLSRQKDFDAVAERAFDQRVEEHLLLQNFSAEDQVEIREYATIHQLTIRESVEYQTHCHNCGKDTPEGFISSGSHQYCSSRCQEYSETYCYSCAYDSECLVCANWVDETVFDETVFV
jgi:hypothetical protein